MLRVAILRIAAPPCLTLDLVRPENRVARPVGAERVAGQLHDISRGSFLDVDLKLRVGLDSDVGMCIVPEREGLGRSLNL